MRKIRLRMGTLVLVALFILSMAYSTIAQPDPAANSGMNSNPALATNPNEVPLGGSTTSPGGGSSSMNTPGSPGLDLQISGNSNSSGGGGEMGGMEAGMDKMEGMDQMMMSQMGGMNSQNNMNSAPMNGIASDNSAILAQLQATNSMILQMITLLSSQPNGTNPQPQLQSLYQMMANQTALIQMLNNASMNSAPSGNSGSMNNMGGSGGGMGMM